MRIPTIRGVRALSWVAVVSALTLTATACGGGATDVGTKANAQGPSAAASASPTGPLAQIQAMPKDQQRAKALELAKSEGSLALYTSLTEDVANAVKKAFTEQTGVQVNLFRANGETVVQRIVQEAQANKLGADAVETDFFAMAPLSQEGLLEKFNGASLDTVKDAGRFDDWTATRFNIFLPAWNTNLIKPGEEPKSWEDLADPRFKGKITLEIGDSDWYESVTHYWLENGKTQAEVDELWKKIVANSKAAKGHTTMMELLGAGQTAIDGMNYTYITQRAKEKGAPVAFKLADGTNPIPAFPRPNGVAMFKDAKHPAAAWLFYDWMLTDGQKVLVSLHLTPATKVPGDTSLDGITLADFDVKTLATDAATWDKKYDALLRGVKVAPEK
jgi:iron(III) transport system substrate-binding protein